MRFLDIDTSELKRLSDKLASIDLAIKAADEGVSLDNSSRFFSGTPSVVLGAKEDSRNSLAILQDPVLAKAMRRAIREILETERRRVQARVRRCVRRPAKRGRAVAHGV